MKIEKLIFGGQGLARPESDGSDGRISLAWNALPGEEIEFEKVKKKKTYVEGIASNVIKASPHRIEPVEEHFLSCSPWQILSWDAENEWKTEIARETFERLAKVNIDDLQIVSDDNQFGYRNKMEYSFVDLESGEISLAFFKRGKKWRYPIPGCQLADPIINETASKILEWINRHEIPIRSLKSLIIRSDNQGKSIAALFIKDELPFDDFPVLDDSFVGFTLYYSTHRSPASVPTKLMHSDGQDFLIARLRDVDLKFGLLSFFQVNIPVFERALDDIASFFDPSVSALDFYAGVGAISLPLHDRFKDCVLVENNEQAVEYSEENISAAGLSHCSARLVPAEKTVELIDSEKICIFDPPRAGLHNKVVDRLLDQKPPRVIYMSCNLSTQARDIELLSSAYDVKFFRLYNFFPRTPHIESLCVLERK